MKRKLLILCFVSITILCNQEGFAQDIITDNKGKPIFNMPTSLVAPKLTANSGGVRFPIKRFLGTNYFYYEDNDSSKQKNYTVRKSWSIFGNIEVINNTSSILDFSNKPNISPHFEIGFGNTLDSIYTNVSELKDWYETFSASFFMDYQHFDIYNKETKEYSKFKRWSPGVKVVYNHFKKDIVGLAFTGSYYKNVNISTLTSFQKITDKYYFDPTVASNGKIDGYFAPASVADQLRFSVAMPIFAIPPVLIKKAQFMPAPYYFINSIDYERFTHHAGITVSILPTRIYKTYAKSFAITSAYSVGYNLIDSFNKDKQKYLFFTGSFSFGDLKPAPNEKNKKNVTFLSR